MFRDTRRCVSGSMINYTFDRTNQLQSIFYSGRWYQHRRGEPYTSGPGIER